MSLRLILSNLCVSMSHNKLILPCAVLTWTVESYSGVRGWRLRTPRAALNTLIITVTYLKQLFLLSCHISLYDCLISWHTQFIGWYIGVILHENWWNWVRLWCKALIMLTRFFIQIWFKGFVDWQPKPNQTLLLCVVIWCLSLLPVLW